MIYVLCLFLVFWTTISLSVAHTSGKTKIKRSIGSFFKRRLQTSSYTLPEIWVGCFVHLVVEMTCCANAIFLAGGQKGRTGWLVHQRLFLVDASEKLIVSYQISWCINVLKNMIIPWPATTCEIRIVTKTDVRKMLFYLTIWCPANSGVLPFSYQTTVFNCRIKKKEEECMKNCYF